MTQHLPALLLVKRLAGFTMIELLIVITILGILAVAVLSAINPIEQINRGRDTGSQSDAEQMINAIERYNAFQGFYPWSTDVNPAAPLAWTELSSTQPGDVATPPCPILGKLSTATDPCVGTDELKSSFVTRVSDPDNNALFLYNRGTQGDSTYVCFIPQSNAFQTQARTRCGTNPVGSGLPADLDGNNVRATICPDTGRAYVCLP